MDPASERILDANFNRAREALRVIEDFARLGLDDAGLAAAAKALRHDLSELFRRDALRQLVRARDILGDVGTHNGVPSEYERASLSDVAVAAGKRLSEALRLLEECTKTVDPQLGAAFEQLRYRGYELERQLAVRCDAPRRFGHVRLYVIITEALCTRPWLDTARAAIEGGADALQLREKELSDRQLLERAVQLVDLCRSRGVLCIINDRPDIAVLAGADGVHVGQDDLSVAAARRIVGAERIVGCSTHTLEQAQAAALASPDYIAIGPMFPSPTKPQSQVAGPETFAAVRRITSLPLVAIGGIRTDRWPALAEAGVDRVCVCSAVIGAPDPAAAAALKQQLRAARPQWRLRA
ncbi:MAG TPA: thiamine phosphate synthase [Phycisphaerae bacterium]